MDDPRIALGIPLSWPYVASDFFNSFAVMEKPGICNVIQSTSGPIDEMRNLIARQALERDHTHLMFLDADMTYPRDTIPRLLDWDKPIVSGLCFKRYPPFNPTLFVGDRYNLTLMDPYPKDTLVRVTATGTACMLIKMEIFEQMPYPWFTFDRSSQNDNKPVGEDIGFCYKAADLGFTTWVDTSLKTRHLSLMGVNEDFWVLNKALMSSNQGRFRAHTGDGAAPFVDMAQ